VASAKLDFGPLDLNAWYYDHTEGYISTELAEVGNPTSNAPGSVHPLAATITYTSWQVFRRGVEPNIEYENRNETTAPAFNAGVAFEITGGGGTLAATTASTDGNGRALVNFTMGGSVAEIRATASFAGTTGFGTTTMTPDVDTRTWTKIGSDSSLTVTASASDPGAATALVTATATYTTWEIWQCDQDTTLIENRSQVSGSAINGTAVFSVSSGGATITSSDTATNINGAASATLAKATSDSTVLVSISYGGQAASASVSIGSYIAPPLDSDGDGYSDAEEADFGTDPNDAESRPVGADQKQVAVEGEYEHTVYETVEELRRTDEEGYQRDLGALIAIYGVLSIPDEELAKLDERYPLCQHASTVSRRQRDTFKFYTTISKAAVNVSIDTLLLGLEAAHGVVIIWHAVLTFGSH
jgi:hypothetical protein